MPLVFVHGVGNRMGRAWHDGRAVRELWFQRYVMGSWIRADGARPQIFQPYWGALGASLAWGGASIPGANSGTEMLGGSEDAEDLVALADAVVPIGAGGEAVLLAAARTDLLGAVDLLWAAAIDACPDESEALIARSNIALRYAETNPSPEWLLDVHDDATFIRMLCEALEAELDIERSAYSVLPESVSAPMVEKFGIRRLQEVLREGGARVREIAVGRTVGAGADTARARLLPRVTEFLGDVLVYFRTRGLTAGQTGIGLGVAEVLQRAHALRQDGDPLVVVAHSMGGDIAFDLLSGPLIDIGITVDVLATVGSQVGFFQELDLFGPRPADIPGIAGQRLPIPVSIAHWVNIYDAADVLSFRAEPVFEGVRDYEFRSGRLNAHSGYFATPSFYLRLGERIRAAL